MKSINCKKCGTELTDQTRHQTKTHLCKTCFKKYNAEYYAKNKEKFREHNRNWVENNREKLQEYMRQWRKNNKDKISVYRREWLNKSDENKEKQKQAIKLWAENNKERHLEIMRLVSMRRRVLKAGAEGSFTLKEFEDKCIEFGFRCAYCHTELSDFNVSIDHIVPLSKGGSNSIGNINPCCRTCNSSKNDLDLEEWLASRN
jgi:5-methylcytosine-specific restriction endonuclease McrA